MSFHVDPYLEDFVKNDSSSSAEYFSQPSSKRHQRSAQLGSSLRCFPLCHVQSHFSPDGLIDPLFFQMDRSLRNGEIVVAKGWG